MVHDVGNWKHRNANADDDPVSEEKLCLISQKKRFYKSLHVQGILHQNAFEAVEVVLLPVR